MKLEKTLPKTEIEELEYLQSKKPYKVWSRGGVIIKFESNDTTLNDFVKSKGLT